MTRWLAAPSEMSTERMVPLSMSCDVTRLEATAPLPAARAMTAAPASTAVVRERRERKVKLLTPLSEKALGSGPPVRQEGPTTPGVKGYAGCVSAHPCAHGPRAWRARSG